MAIVKSSEYELRAKQYRDQAEDCRRRAKTAFASSGTSLAFIAETYDALAIQMDELAKIYRTA